MPIQYADKPKQPGESLRYAMTFTPGLSLASGDSLAGSPTVAIATYPGGVDKSETMIVAGSVSRSGNQVYVMIQGGTSGLDYKITFKSDTAGGEKSVEEELVIEVREY